MTLAALGSFGAKNSTPKDTVLTGSFLRPTSDDTNPGGWQGNPSGGALWSQINEVLADDAVTSISSSGAGNRFFTVFCANPDELLPKVTGDAGVILRCRHKGDAGPPPAQFVFGLELHSGSTFASATLVATQVFGGDNQIWGDRELALTAGQIASMGNWKDAIVLASSNAGAPDSVSQIEIEFVSGTFKPTV